MKLHGGPVAARCAAAWGGLFSLTGIEFAQTAQVEPPFKERLFRGASWVLFGVLGLTASGLLTPGTLAQLVAPAAPSLVISCPGDVQLQCGESTDPSHTGAASVISASCPDTPLISYVDAPLPADCTARGLDRSWIASACGTQSLTCVQHIRFTDNEPPIFGRYPPLDDSVPCGFPVPPPPPLEVFQVTDNCDPSPLLTFSETRSAPSPDGSYTILRVWTATDLCGNASHQGELIFVEGCISAADLTSISGSRFYDANGDGLQDAGEPGLAGWPMLLTGGPGPISLVTYTDSAGHYSFDGVAAGAYTLSAQVPLQPNWRETTPTSVVALGGGPATSYNFGAVCFGAGGAQGIGFWTTKNGLRALQASGLDTELARLRSLHLRNLDGSDFDPTTYDQLKTWLSGAKSSNLAYMLSAQLACACLDIDTGLINGDALIQAAGLRCASPNGYARVQGLLAEADAELKAHPVATTAAPGNAFRPYQNLLQNALAAANNNQAFLQPVPSTYTFGP